MRGQKHHSDGAGEIPNSQLEEIAIAAHFKPQDTAALCPMSLRQLERLVQRRFGKSLEQWCRELRLRLAIEMVQRGFKNQVVADALFFTDAAHLCHEFQSLLGRTPQSFRPTYWDRKKGPGEGRIVA